MLPHDLHIHSTWSRDHSAIVPEQAIDLIAAVGHAETVGISDHFEPICDDWIFHYYDCDTDDAALGR